MTQNSMFPPDAPVFIIAEMSANHNQNYDRAVKIIEAAHEAGADAVKLQSYTPDTMTIDCDDEHFRIKGTIWEGRTLYDLYKEAYTPWEWYPRLQAVADRLGIILFSTPFDTTAVDYLESIGAPCHKIASFELTDIPLIKKVAATGKPTILSTGMANEAEIQETIDAFKGAGGNELVLLKCTSAYPAPPEEANLRTIPYLAKRFGVVSGLSDHTLSIAIASAAVALGAKVIEKHFCLDHSLPGPDSSFSLDPKEFATMAQSVREVEKALGTVSFELTDKEKANTAFRRSIYVVRDVRKGEVVSPDNIRVIRPAYGMAPRHYEDVLGKHFTAPQAKGTPLTDGMVK